MRVVAGRLRGRVLRGRAGPTSRPTSDRARAGLFDWLGSRVMEADVLDLFAGTGALAIEALSRGARSATLVESDRRTLFALRTNVHDLGLEEQCRVLGVDVRRALGRLREEAQRFDLLLADPPYQGDWAERLVAREGVAELLAPGAALILERARRDPPTEPCASLALVESRSYGETRFDRYEPTEATAP